MSGLPFDDFDELCLNLQAIFSGDNLTIRQANDTIEKMGQHPVEFTNAMVKVILHENATPQFLRIKKAAVIVFSKKALPYFEMRKTPEEIKVHIMEATISCLYSPNVPMQTKVQFSAFLKSIFALDKGYVLKDKSMEHALQKLASNQINDYSASIILMQSLISDGRSQPKKIADWWIGSLELLLKAGDVMIEGVGAEIKELVEGKDKEKEEEKVLNLIVGLTTLKSWAELIEEFIRRLGRNNPNDLAKPNYLELIVDKEPLVKALLTLLAINIPVGSQIEDCIFSTTGLALLDIALNGVKAVTLKCFSDILDFRADAAIVVLQGKSPVLNNELNKFFQLISNEGMKAILTSMFKLSRSGYLNISSALEDKTMHEFLCECLLILTYLVPIKELYDLFSDDKNIIIMDICIPIIASTDKEKEMFHLDPIAFVNLTSGLNDEEEGESTSNSAKIQAIYLLKEICYHLDGGATTLLRMIESLIEFSFVPNEENTAKLQEYKDSISVTQLSDESRVETCILILAGTYNCFLERVDLLIQIEKFFLQYADFFLGAESGALIKARMCLFLGYFASTLFLRDESNEQFARHIGFMIDCTGLSKREPGVVEQACESLLELLTEGENQMRMRGFITEIFSKLTTFIPHTTCVGFFDLLRNIVEIYCPILTKSPEVIGEFMIHLVAKAVEEYKFVQTDAGLSTMTLTKIWNIINTIGASKQYILEFRDDFDAALKPLFDPLYTDKNVPYDNDALRYLQSTIRITEKVTPFVWQVFRAFEKLLENNKWLITPLFPCLNQIIVYGKEQIEEDETILAALIEMGIKGLEPTHKDANKAGPAMAALHFQVLIQYVGIPDALWERMLLACYRSLLRFEKDKEFVKARLGGVILLAFLRNFDTTQKIFLHENALGKVMETFLNHAVVFDNHIYDRKVFIIGMCSFLSESEKADKLIIHKLPQILDILIGYLKYVQFMEKKQGGEQKKGKELAYDTDSDDEGEKKLRDRDVLKILLGTGDTSFLNSHEEEKVDDDDDDDDEYTDDEDEDTEYYPTDKGEVNHYAARMIAGIKDQDEFGVFRNAINNIREKNNALLTTLGKGLPENKFEFLKEVMMSQRVTVNQGANQGTTTQARKIVKTVSRKVTQANQ